MRVGSSFIRVVLRRRDRSPSPLFVASSSPGRGSRRGSSACRRARSRSSGVSRSRRDSSRRPPSGSPAGGPRPGSCRGPRRPRARRRPGRRASIRATVPLRVPVTPVARRAAGRLGSRIERRLGLRQGLFGDGLADHGQCRSDRPATTGLGIGAGASGARAPGRPPVRTRGDRPSSSRRTLRRRRSRPWRGRVPAAVPRRAAPARPPGR